MGRSTTSSTPRRVSSATTSGTKRAATSRCTSRVSAELHTPGRWHLALTVIGERHGEVGGGVDVDVAVAPGGGDHRHPAVLGEQLLELLAAARDDDVDQALEGDHLEQRLARPGDEGDRLGRQAGFEHRALHDLGQHAVGVFGRAAAAQHDGVARLQAEPGGVDGHVGARLVDDGDHAERHAHARELDAVGQPAPVFDLADRVGQRGQLADARGSLFEPVLV